MVSLSQMLVLMQLLNQFHITNRHFPMSFPTEPAATSKNSVFVNTGVKSIASIPILPIRDTVKAKSSVPAFDIVDEVLYHFRTNLFMRDFAVKSDADRLLIYLTFYAQKCLKFFAKNKGNKLSCQKEIEKWNLDPFVLPGDGGFILAALVTEPKTPQEKNELKSFLTQARTEVGNRLLRIVFGEGKEADKWWICFAARKFMDKEMGA
jgi:actin related protein 2/3 complex subunit 3